MIVIKGKSGKSRIIADIMSNNETICYQYCKECVNPLDGIFIDSNQYSIEALKSNILQDELNVNEYIDYLIIYTNERECDLLDFIQWLENNNITFCTQIIITCV